MVVVVVVVVAVVFVVVVVARVVVESCQEQCSKQVLAHSQLKIVDVNINRGGSEDSVPKHVDVSKLFCVFCGCPPIFYTILESKQSSI